MSLKCDQCGKLSAAPGTHCSEFPVQPQVDTCERFLAKTPENEAKADAYPMPADAVIRRRPQISA